MTQTVYTITTDKFVKHKHKYKFEKVKSKIDYIKNCEKITQFIFIVFVMFFFPKTTPNSLERVNI